ncbi:ferredoxin [Nocardia goodfellowii]|uniref:Ferredoxin n=1 Tax=Nocardia goodfellowii TaxID=882446 RepID=A0ABS4QGK2_9NOCA|nr:ferredoxin [Nocardia goodfellowii]MBP2190209.1 ferredoxin [Nocardia goodfellowii]
MRIEVDWGRCEGHGICADKAPKIFRIDDDGDLVHGYDGTDVPDTEISAGRSAIGACPVAALREKR